MKITIAGTGYVGLVTGVCLADVGHTITCFDIDERKIQELNGGKSPIYEPGLEDLITKNLEAKRLHFTSEPEQAYADADCIFIAVGTPENEDGSANLSYVEQAAIMISEYIHKDTVIVVKSTVPVGTNERIARIIKERVDPSINIEVASNPEFLREGSAIHDTFNGDRIVIGTESQETAQLLRSIYEPLNIPIVTTDIRSAEMIKYASNAFLATKISFINEIANLCEKTGANIEEVAEGMGYDKRIGNQFLRAGIGYGGSCFPKDTKALNYLAKQYDFDFRILESVINVNKYQKDKLFLKAKELFQDFTGKKVTVLGLAFKPNTDDIREAPSIDIIESLLKENAQITVFDPIAMGNVEELFHDKINYANSALEAIQEADMVFIVTEWREIKELTLAQYKESMAQPVIFDGRNCYPLHEAKELGIQYYSIGRKPVE
ncbi:UDP-glucose dehydrogenase family protein [Bacillus dakarensis]|uniref:UDP-glucose dehydrogenase family protein n=1 Tax=Robertmurraya dakarensis TaxID=1926278 RepID=UPI0009810CFD|nr:UDP-glucose/GDP-mannose dehydrogenase family protein [Bacillus dakarensis]